MTKLLLVAPLDPLFLPGSQLAVDARPLPLTSFSSLVFFVSWLALCAPCGPRSSRSARTPRRFGHMAKACRCW
eukprot:1734896-Pyramimonas_sp.AAC.1